MCVDLIPYIQIPTTSYLVVADLSVNDPNISHNSHFSYEYTKSLAVTAVAT